jgi:ATP-dependent DNA helicase RecG
VTLERRAVTSLKGVGPALAKRLAHLGIQNVADLLFWLPTRYEDRTHIVPIGSLRPGMRAAVEGTIELAEVVFRGRRSLLVRLADGTGFLTLRFFHFSGAQQQQLVRGARLRCFGEVRRGKHGPEIVHPEYKDAAAPDTQAVEHVLTPIYPVTEGVQQGRLRNLTAQALAAMADGELPDFLPQEIVRELGLPGLHEALQYVHRPPPDARLDVLAAGRHPSQRRLAFEELLAQQLSLRQLRAAIRRDPAIPVRAHEQLAGALLAGTGFTLTRAQERVLREVRADLAVPHPMMRLVQGDVGSGKTIVAALAAADTVEAGFQVALMAPTELLAEQHAQNFVRWLAPLGLEPLLLTGRMPARARREALAALASGQQGFAIGTHALFQEEVGFARLALVIVDEQHRFGVQQRMRLREKGTAGRFPHQLIMTATPIPRTLAMTAYADLDISVIDELPPGRTPVTTVAMPDSRRDEVVQRIRGACLAGRQAYWVCPLIQESEVLEAQAAEDAAAVLAEALPDIAVGIVHGRMPPAAREKAMAEFKAGRIGLLVATTVIEVGVDVPNASLMVIENAERMGLAQLHQLRGRVGRGREASTCVLLWHAPLSPLAKERLAAVRATNDGFEIARRDLELRGPGELLGTRQAGLMQLKVADLMRDADLLPRVHTAADVMLRAHAANMAPLERRWVGAGTRYGKV